MNNSYNLISFNKNYISENDFRIHLTNRAFRYGDGMFETMHANGLKVQFIKDHFKRILKGTGLLQLDLPDYFTEPFLEEQVAGLLARLKLFQGARVRLSLFRSGEGLFFAESNDCNVLIEAAYLSKGLYELNDKGITIGIYQENLKPITSYNSIKSMNSLPYILAANYAKNNNFDDVLLLNSHRNICEATSSNFFALKENVIYTPPLNAGPVEGIMRKQVLKIAEVCGYDTNETDLTVAQLKNVDEMFLTNAVSGIKYISGYENKRFYKRVARKLLKGLNEIAFD